MYDVALLTPVLNRANKLELIARSICMEKYSVIWLIGDDGSTDNVEQEVKRLVTEYKVPIKYIGSNYRIGKASMDNLLIKHANARFLLWCDAGDFFINNSVEKLLDLAYDYKRNFGNTDFIGILSRNVDSNNKPQTIFNFKMSHKTEIFAWDDIEREILGDGTLLINRDVIGENRFPEVDFVINESSLWRSVFYGKKILVTEHISKLMERCQIDSISNKSNEMKYIFGMYTSIRLSEFTERYTKAKMVKKLILNIRYFRYAKHLNIGFIEALNQWPACKQNSKMIAVLSHYVSYFYYIYDILGKTIVLTHLLMPKPERVILKIKDHC